MKSKISELELLLLLNRDNVESKLYLLLEETQPSYSTVERTIRQMGLFVEIIKRFSIKGDYIVAPKVDKVISILDGYLNTSVFNILSN